VLAEDDPDIRLILSSSLELWGYDVLALADGAEALSAIRESLPDIALLDINMPGLTGPEIIRTMRRDPTMREIPAMLITAEAAGPAAQSGLANGADDYVRKPFHLGELRERVVSLTIRGRNLRELQSLQRAVALPDAVRDVDGVRAVGLNRPFPGALAGGDFMAVTASPGGTVTAVVGDVEGHGVAASALAAFSRAVLATNATFTAEPGLLLSLADWTLAQRDRDDDGYLSMVTALCVVVDPRAGVVKWASAGHPAPLFFADRDAQDEDAGLPLGAGQKPVFPVHTRKVAPGDRILMFTDGLMRATFGPSDFTESMLPWLLISGEDLSLPEMIDKINASYSTFLGSGGEDDLSLLLLEMPPSTG
jgi:CheY-like chemotaxis protein